MGCCGKSGSQAIKTALQTERDGLKMYTEIAENASNPAAKKMFLALAEDEKAHIRIIERVADGMGISTAMNAALPGTPKERIKTVFSEAGEDVKGKFAAAETDRQALKIAMDFEKKGYDFYSRAALGAPDEDEKKLFEFLAYEENVHYEILRTALDYLEDSDHWFLWDEQGLLEG